MLTNRSALEIAHYYGLRLRTDGKMIRAELAWARENDGKHGTSAATYFDGYLAETVRVELADARAHADFCRNAY